MSYDVNLQIKIEIDPIKVSYITRLHLSNCTAPLLSKVEKLANDTDIS